MAKNAEIFWSMPGRSNSSHLQPSPFSAVADCEDQGNLGFSKLDGPTLVVPAFDVRPFAMAAECDDPVKFQLLPFTLSI